MKCKKLLLIVLVISCLVFSCVIPCSASAVNPPRHECTSASATNWLLTNQPHDWSDLNMYPHRACLFVNINNGDGYAFMFVFGSPDPIKFSQGELWVGVNQSLFIRGYIGYWTSNNIYAPYDNYSWGTLNSIEYNRWMNGSGDSSNYKKWLGFPWSNSIINQNPAISNFPIYDYNSEPTIWEYVIPPSTDMYFYQSPSSNEPTLRLPFIEVGGTLDGSTFVQDDGTILIQKTGEYGISWDSGIGGIFKNIIRCAGAKKENAEPLTFTFRGREYTYLDPAWFNFSGMDAVRVVMLIALIIDLVVFLKNMIMKTISAQGNGDGE